MLQYVANDIPPTAAIFTRLNVELAMAPCKLVNVSDDLDWFAKAANLARLSPHNKHKVGAILVQKNRVIAHATNSFKTHPMQARWNKKSDCLHAEISVLIEAFKNPCFIPRKSVLYVARVSRKDKPVCSYPCKSCWCALSAADITKIVCCDFQDRIIRI